MIKRCHTCQCDIDLYKEASTTCSECREIFCASYHSSCFSEHKSYDKCCGTCLTITNPQWVVNMMRTRRKVK